MEERRGERMYEVVVILKALTEVAGVAFLGQGILWVIAGAKREQNLIYKLFKVLTSPVTRFTRAITPRVIIDAHIGLVAFFLLTVLWLALTVFKVKLVLDRAAGVG
jgi:uncharacterized membrane protein